MKVRNGFVSNSSSSSFLIYGTTIPIEGEYNWKIREDLENQINEKGLKLEFHYVDYYDGFIYIGMSWDCIEDDETGAEFKKRVEKECEKLLDKRVDCETFECAWENR